MLRYIVLYLVYHEECVAREYVGREGSENRVRYSERQMLEVTDS